MDLTALLLSRLQFALPCGAGLCRGCARLRVFFVLPVMLIYVAVNYSVVHGKARPSSEHST
jgi:hypothetical protein